MAAIQIISVCRLYFPTNYCNTRSLCSCSKYKHSTRNLRPASVQLCNLFVTCLALLVRPVLCGDESIYWAQLSTAYCYPT